MDLTPEDLLTWLEGLTQTPLLFAAALALSTLVTEDGAVVVGSLLVGSGVASPILVVAALIVGIVGGDIALYAAGWSARKFRPLRRNLPLKKARKLRAWLKGREAAVLFFSRFMPGTRLITYVSFGFLRLSLPQFTAVMLVAATLWVTSLVFFISEVQQALAGVGALWATVITAVFAGLVIYFIPRAIARLKPAKALASMPGVESETKTDD